MLREERELEEGEETSAEGHVEADPLLNTMRPDCVWSDLHGDYILDMCVIGAEYSITKSPLLLTTSKDGSHHIIDLATHVIRRTIRASAPPAPAPAGAKSRGRAATARKSWANTVAFSPDGRVAALGSFDNAVSVHATHTGALLRQIVVQNDGIAKMLFSSCGRFLFLGTATGKLQLVAL